MERGTIRLLSKVLTDVKSAIHPVFFFSFNPIRSVSIWDSIRSVASAASGVLFSFQVFPELGVLHIIFG